MILAYSPALWGPPIYEDPVLFQFTDLQRTLGSRGPLTALSMWLTPTPFLAHLGNVGVHLLNGVILYRIALLLMTPIAAAVATGVFWLHPIQTEAVAYLTGRSELLATCGILLTLWCLLLKAPTLVTMLSVTLAGCVAFAAKEITALSLVLYLPILAIWQQRSLWTVAVPIKLWTSLALVYINLSMATLFVRNWTAIPLAPLDWIARQCAAAWHLIRLMVLPIGQAIETPAAALPSLSLIAMLGAGIAVWWAPKPYRIAGLWLLAGLLPRILIRQPIPIQPEPLHEHHLYAVMVGVVLGIGSRWR